MIFASVASPSTAGDDRASVRLRAIDPPRAESAIIDRVDMRS
ncbi:hypothetical protein [Streptomyces calvus]